MLGFVFVCLGQSICFPNISALISRAAPPDRQGEMMGLNTSGMALGRIGGPVVAGQLFSRTRLGAPFAFVGAADPAGAVVRGHGREAGAEAGLKPDAQCQVIGRTTSSQIIREVPHAPVPRLAAVLALALPAAAQTPPDPDGGRGFDFLIGDWKAKLRQLDKPLTGSTTWVEYEGISRTHKVLDTNANFEEFAVRPTGAAGKPKKGQTLRLYNPETREWSIYLVDADQGLLRCRPRSAGSRTARASSTTWSCGTAAPSWCATSGRPNAGKPHFEQAFSTDGGKSWEVNWVLDLTPEKR